MKFKKIAAVILSIICILSSFTGCSKNKETQKDMEKETVLTVPYSSDVILTNPAFEQINKRSEVNNVLYSPLFYYDGVQVVTSLADSVEFKDNKEVKLVLRKDIKWHDGVSITSDDILYTMNLILNEDNASPLRKYLTPDGESITIEKIDDNTINIMLPIEKSDFLFGLSRIIPIPKHIFENEASVYTSEKNLSPVGSGPFKFSDYKKDDYLILEKFNDYYSGVPKIDRIEFKKYLSSDAEEIALSEGSLTLMKDGTELFNKYKDNDDYKVFEFDEGKVNCIIFNQNNDAMKDIDIRKGLSYALNRKKLIQAAYGDENASSEAKSIFHPDTIFYREDNVEEYNYDQEKAKQLLEMSNTKLQNITITYNIEEQHHKAYAEKAGEELSELGYTVVVNGLGAKEFNKLISSGDADTSLYVTGYTLGINPDNYKEMFRTGGNYSHYGYSNINIDELWDAAYSEIDNEKMKGIYSEIQGMILEDAPVYLIDYEKSYLASNKKLKGIEEAKLVPELIFRDWSKLSIKD